MPSSSSSSARSSSVMVLFKPIPPPNQNDILKSLIVTPHIKLIGTENSYFTAKARSYLLHKQIPFEEVLASTDIYSQVILKYCHGVSMIPVIVDPQPTQTQDTEGPIVIQDTKRIIEYLELKHSSTSTYSTPSTPIWPSPVPSPIPLFASLLIELIADEWMILPAMHYRWNKPSQYNYLYHEFGATVTGAKDPSQQSRINIGSKAASYFKKSIPNLGVTESTQSIIEFQFELFLQRLSNHLERYPWSRGDRRCIADIAMNGPLYAHLYRDPVPGKLVKETAPLVAEYIERCENRNVTRVVSSLDKKKALLNGGGAKEVSVTEMMGDVAALSGLNAMGPYLKDMLGYLLNVATLLKTHALNSTSRPQNPLRRTLGSVEFDLTVSADDRTKAVKATRIAFVHPLWMIWRIKRMVYDRNRDGCVGFLKMLEFGGEECARLWVEINKGLEEVGELEFLEGKVVMMKFPLVPEVGKGSGKSKM
ncbi:hypothetical protein HDU76_009313 [Blyttiomyces sp. JEL0837]|nr:hypothetical protein HDU76_009313 [Blyttiomyces sp. JEL0837]